MKFQLGDRVYLPQIIDHIAAGTKATIIAINQPDGRIGIQLDIKDRHRHSCGGAGKEGLCWNVSPKHIKKYLETPEDIEKDRYNRVITKIKYLDNKFEVQQKLKKLKKGKPIEKVQDIPIQNEQQFRFSTLQWPTNAPIADFWGLPPTF
jgi:hypothetical protein